MLLLVPQGSTALCDTLRDSSLEQHAFPRLLGRLNGPRAAGFKGPDEPWWQVSPRKCLCGEQTPAQTQRMQDGSLFLPHISLSEMCQNYLLMAHSIKRLLCGAGWGRRRVLDEKLLGAGPFIFRH